LMVEDPDKMLESFAEAGADHIHVHYEASPDLNASLARIRELGCKAGIAINPATPASAITEALPNADIVLVMSVNPGYSGQTFISEVLPKVSELSEMIAEADLPAVIEIDGGIDTETLPAALAAGARVFVAASAVFKHKGGVAAGMQALRNAALQGAH
jgi:ribulose-phosphate 3-epimerase